MSGVTLLAFKRRSHEFWAFDRPKIGMLKDASHQIGMVTGQDWGIVCPTKMWSWSTKRRILANQTSNITWISRVNCQWTSAVIFMKNQLIYAAWWIVGVTRSTNGDTTKHQDGNHLHWRWRRKGNRKTEKQPTNQWFSYPNLSKMFNRRHCNYRECIE